MTRKLSLLLVPVTLLVLVITGSASTAPPPAPVASCSPGSSNCFDWHTSPVTVSWSHPGCPATTISSDTGGTPVSCTASNAEGSTTTTVNVRKDGSPPGVRAEIERGPDSNGWYNHAVRVGFAGDEGLSGIASCSSAVTYSGPDTGTASVSGSCTDGAGNTGSGSIQFPYDATAPTVEGKLDRGPDANGWYNRAVTVSFLGTDPLAGIHVCTAPVVYKGPDTAKASLSGVCQDKASNTSQPKAVELSYDATPPLLKRVKAEISSRGIALKWIASKDAQSFTIQRRPGLKKHKLSTVYSGKARSFLDGRLIEGVTYRYTVTAFDQAGNGAARGLRAKALQTVSRQSKPSRTTSALRAPAAGARLTSPPVLRWSAVPKASYYNVQLFRDGKKILTLWPTDSTLRVPSAWTFAGTAFRLTPGVYRWYVWPGFGPRSANRYGKLLGTRRFVVIRR
jgi:hypothetical protein